VPGSRVLGRGSLGEGERLGAIAQQQLGVGRLDEVAILVGVAARALVLNAGLLVLALRDVGADQSKVRRAEVPGLGRESVHLLSAAPQSEGEAGELAGTDRLAQPGAAEPKAQRALAVRLAQLNERPRVGRFLRDGQLEACHGGVDSGGAAERQVLLAA
jgi:hypothetical protein